MPTIPRLVASSLAFNALKLLEVFQGEVLNICPTDRRADQESQKRGDAEIDGNTRIHQIVFDRHLRERVAGLGTQPGHGRDPAGD